MIEWLVSQTAGKEECDSKNDVGRTNERMQFLHPSALTLHRGRGFFSQIGLDYLWIVSNFERRTLRDLEAVIEHVNSLADAHDERHVMFDKEHGDLELLANLPNEFHEG